MEKSLASPPRTSTWIPVGLEGLRKGLKDLKLWATFSKAAQTTLTSAGAPASHRYPPLQNSTGSRAGVLQMLPKLHQPPRHRCSGCWGDQPPPHIPHAGHSCPLTPPLSPCLPAILSSFTLRLFPVVPLEEPEALTLSLCFQDFGNMRKASTPTPW